MGYEELEELAIGLRALTGEQLYVIAGLFWDDCTERDLAVELSEHRGTIYSRDRIHRIKLTALAKMSRAIAVESGEVAA